MALASYRTRVSQLLQNPTSPTINPLYSTTDIDGWINQARVQVAAEGECLRAIGTVSTVSSQRPYAFTSINIGVAATVGLAGVLHVRRINRTSGLGQVYMTPRSWEWYDQYHYNNASPTNGPPTVWAQYAQGASWLTGQTITSVGGGSFYVDPPPDAVYTLNCDCVCFPIILADDTTKEAIPLLWTDAVAYFASYLALMSSQTSARANDAQRLLGLYNNFMQRARQFANPSVVRNLYEQATDPTQINKLGMVQKAQGQ